MVQLTPLALAAIMASALASAGPMERRGPRQSEKPCQKLSDQARSSVLNDRGMQVVARLNQDTQFKQGAYSEHANYVPNGPVGLYLKAEANAPAVGIFSFEDLISDLPRMFWLAKGDECRLRNEDMDGVDTSRAEVRAKTH
ncbi:hypothetical protein CBS101457_005064 [Exobasidium rhododendri]|nr:hypothetical protein CBS101457_005064 [Exobasidium rhododendri]